MIYISTNHYDKIIDMINSAFPYICIYHRPETLENVLLWKDFRKKVLSVYGIKFSDYTKRTKYFREIFK